MPWQKTYKKLQEFWKSSGIDLPEPKMCKRLSESWKGSGIHYNGTVLPQRKPKFIWWFQLIWGHVWVTGHIISLSNFKNGWCDASNKCHVCQVSQTKVINSEQTVVSSPTPHNSYHYCDYGNNCRQLFIIMMIPN